MSSTAGNTPHDSAPHDNAKSRAAIMSRVREALSVPTKGRPAPTGTSIEEFKECLPAVGDDLDDRLELFERYSELLKTQVFTPGNREAAARCIADLAQAEGWSKVAYHPFDGAQPCIDALTSAPQPCQAMLIDGEYPADELEQCDAGITGCEALISQTGSVLVTSQSSGGRALSVLPPHHVVFATRSQLIADLPDAYALLRQRYDGAWPSFMSVISGPSRTGDIERILVLGAHGPKKLTVVIVED